MPYKREKMTGKKQPINTKVKAYKMPKNPYL